MNEFINSRVDEKTKDHVAKMTPLEKDQMFRALWFDCVAEDLNSVNTYKDLNGIDISRAAERFVYDGDYDCELDYWSQLEHVLAEVEKEKKFKSKIKTIEMSEEDWNKIVQGAEEKVKEHENDILVVNEDLKHELNKVEFKTVLEEKGN